MDTLRKIFNIQGIKEQDITLDFNYGDYRQSISDLGDMSREAVLDMLSKVPKRVFVVAENKMQVKQNQQRYDEVTLISANKVCAELVSTSLVGNDFCASFRYCGSAQDVFEHNIWLLQEAAQYVPEAVADMAFAVRPRHLLLIEKKHDVDTDKVVPSNGRLHAFFLSDIPCWLQDIAVGKYTKEYFEIKPLIDLLNGYFTFRGYMRPYAIQYGRGLTFRVGALRVAIEPELDCRFEASDPRLADDFVYGHLEFRQFHMEWTGSKLDLCFFTQKGALIFTFNNVKRENVVIS